MTPAGPAGAAVTQTELDALRDVVSGAESEFLADLRHLVDIDCGSYTKSGVDEVGRWVADAFQRIGGDVEVLPNERLGDTVVGRFAGAADGPIALLIGHMDSVFEPGTVAERPFRTQGGRAYGPGVTDMKSGLLCGLYAIRAVMDVVGVPFRQLVYIANPDEEIGSPVSSPVIRQHAVGSDVALVLECARENGDIVSSRKGVADLHIVITGRAAHAGVEPCMGRSAVL